MGGRRVCAAALFRGSGRCGGQPGNPIGPWGGTGGRILSLITIKAGSARLVLAPEIGGSIAGWTRKGEPIMRPIAADALTWREPREMSSYPLFPFSNRVCGNRFTFGGATYELARTL